MKSVFFLLFCLVLASAVKSSKMNDKAKDPQKYEDELLDETVNGRPFGGTEGDEKKHMKENDDKFHINGEAFRAEEIDSDEAPSEVIDGKVVYHEGDEQIDETAEDEAFHDDKFHINGEAFRAVDIDSDEAPSEVVDGKVVYHEGDEQIDETAEDEALHGWEKIPFSWCTINGRSLISKSRAVITTFQECQKRCKNRPGCTAIEYWAKYNYACFECNRLDLIEPYTYERDLAYPANVWIEITPTFPPLHPEVNVTCGKNEMSISIPKKLLHGLDREHLRLSDLKCGATETSTHFILRTDLTECATKSRHTKEFVCYMNKVEEIPVELHQIITRVREVEIPFSCYYTNMGVVSAVGLQVKSKKIVFSKKGYGKFVLEMKIYPDGSFHFEYRKKDFPIMVKLREILYVEVSVDTEDRRLSILAEECWATPESDPFKPGLRYTFIKDGCAIDDTVVSIATADKRTQRFELEAFNFIGDHQFVYMHCKVKVCNASDTNSRCAQGCIGRKKRSLMTQETKDEEYNLVHGPFMRSDEDETQHEETMKDMRDVDKSGKFPTLVAAMAVVAAVCVMGVSYFAWNQRKQKALRDYQRLTVPAED